MLTISDQADLRSLSQRVDLMKQGRGQPGETQTTVLRATDLLEKRKDQCVLSDPWEAGFMGDVHLFTIMFLLVEIPGTLLSRTQNTRAILRARSPLSLQH